MRVVVTVEHRFERTPNGEVWTQTVYANPFWSRYLKVFDAVEVVARVKDVERPPPHSARVDGPGVTVAPIPYYVGPAQYLRKALAVRAAARQSVRDQDAVIVRSVSPISTAVVTKLASEGRPYAIEVVGDPYDTLAPGAVRHPMRALFREWFTLRMKQLCRHAAAASYVTSHTLQKRYPPGHGTFTTHYSSVELPAGCFVSEPRPPRTEGPYALVLVGSLEQLYKGPDVAIEAIRLCIASGLELSLTLIGDGRHRAELEAQAKTCGVESKVKFLGQLSAGPAVRAELDRADLFILPSRTEGLPRALIEAMGRGLPALGSAVGGFPELLPSEDLVPPGNASALAAKISEVLKSPERRLLMSGRNLQKAREYQEDVLTERRTAFYQYIQRATDTWIRRSRS